MFCEVRRLLLATWRAGRGEADQREGERREGLVCSDAVCFSSRHLSFFLFCLPRRGFINSQLSRRSSAISRSAVESFLTFISGTFGTSSTNPHKTHGAPLLLFPLSVHLSILHYTLGMHVCTDAAVFLSFFNTPPRFTQPTKSTPIWVGMSLCADEYMSVFSCIYLPIYLLTYVCVCLSVYVRRCTSVCV